MADPTAMFVRPATPDDLAAIRAFDEWKVVDQERIGADECAVAGVDDGVLAYGILDRSFCNRRFVAILFVHPEHRSRGLGDALLRHFEASGPEGEKLWISTTIENLAMQRLLHRRGYELAGVINNLGRIPELFFFKSLTTETSATTG